MKHLITDHPDYDIRYSKPEDLFLLKKWVSQPDSKKWFSVSTAQEIETLTKNWIGFARFKASLTANYKAVPIGISTLFLMPYQKLIHHALLYIVVDPDKRKQGVGTSLIKNITHLAKSYFRLEQVVMETYAGCLALSILEKQGYKKIIYQDHFVKEQEGRYLARVIMNIQLKETKIKSG